MFFNSQGPSSPIAVGPFVDYSIILKANGQPVKSYKFQVRGGVIQRPETSRIDYEPHAAFISPRYIDISAGSSSDYHMRDMFWVRRVAR
ncbi:MAG TPA: hypothetical protein VGW76_00295 [Pyrinomonadaceae bacterium]|nr:hypothetical protein [Pyrinomonadaceae bacterium]